MAIGDDLVPLLVPPGAPELGYRQGEVIAWDSSDGTNTVRVAGIDLEDLPTLGGSELTSLAPGDVVGLLRFRSSWFVLGRITTTGTAGKSTRVVVKTDEDDQSIQLGPGFINGVSVPTIFFGTRDPAETIDASISAQYDEVDGSSELVLFTAEAGHGGLFMAMETPESSGVASDGLGIAFGQSGSRSSGDVPFFISSSYRLIAANGNQAELGARSAVQAGPTAGNNVAIGASTIQSRDNGAAEPLFLNNYGGDIFLGDDLAGQDIYARGVLRPSNVAVGESVVNLPAAGLSSLGITYGPLEGSVFDGFATFSTVAAALVTVYMTNVDENSATIWVNSTVAGGCNVSWMVWGR